MFENGELVAADNDMVVVLQLTQARPGPDAKPQPKVRYASMCVRGRAPARDFAVYTDGTPCVCVCVCVCAHVVKLLPKPQNVNSD